MRATRAAVPRRALDDRSARIVNHLLERPEYRTAQGVALFWPILERGEIDLRGFDARCRAEGRRVYYPSVDPESERLGFRLTHGIAEVRQRGAPFAEPDPAAPWAERGEIDWIVVPALGVDGAGHRLGYGSGFYDQVLPQFCPPARSVVVAYSFQLLAELPVEPHDALCDAVVTDRGSP